MRLTRILLCAWIVWGVGPFTGGVSHYNALASFKYKDICEDMVHGIEKIPGSPYLRFVCLPDTINPNAR